MRVLLVNPPIVFKVRLLDYVSQEVRDSFARRVLVGPPLALNELAGMLPDDEIIILDQKTEEENDPNYDYLERFEQVFREFQPDFIGITCITAQYNSVIQMIRRSKQLDPRTFVSVGGLHATLCPEGFIGSGVDVISIGIGKHSIKCMIDILKTSGDHALLRQVPGLAFDVDGHIDLTPSICSLPYKEVKERYLFDEVMPNRALTDHYSYIIKPLKKSIQYISTSQGCNHKCNFCSIWQMTEGKYFTKNVETIIAELKTMDKYDIIRFCDANTFGNLEESKKLFTRIIEEGLNHHYYMADVRTDFVVRHPEVMALAAKAGLKIVVCGLEAVSDEELAAYNKANSVANIVNGLRILNELGIFVNGNYIIKPSYVAEDFDRLERFVQENPIFHSGFTVLTPFPGTSLYEEMKSEIVITDLDYYNLANAVTVTKLPEPQFYDRMGKLYLASRESTAVYKARYGS